MTITTETEMFFGMKYVIQFGIIMAVSFVGEIVRALLPFKCPASIYGLIIMFVLLKTKILKLEMVKETSHFLVEAMPIMFVPICVELMTSGKVLSEIFVPVVVISVATTFIVMAVTGIVAQKVIEMDKKKSPKNKSDIKTAKEGADI